MSILSTLGAELKAFQKLTGPRDLFARTSSFGLGSSLVSQSNSLDLDRIVSDPLHNGVVAACVNAIARALPDAPLVLEQRTSSGWKAVEDHPCLHVLRSPNPDHSDADVWGLTSGYKATRGQAFWLILPDARGEVGEIHVWNPDRVTVLGDEEQFISGYRVQRESGTHFVADKRQIIHFRHLPDFSNPRLGWSPLRTGRAQIAGDNVAASYHTSILFNAGVVSLLVSLKEGAMSGQVTPEQFQQVLTNLRRAGRERAGGIEGINLPLEVHKLAYSPDEMNIDRLIEYYETRICSVMGVSQRVAGLGSDPTYNNLSEALNDFWERRIVPDRNADAATLNRQWLPLWGLDGGSWRFRFDYSQVPALQENRDALHARVRSDWEKGLVDKQQARALLGYATENDGEFARVFYGEKPQSATTGAEGSTLEMKVWTESEHPRDEEGRFTNGGSGSLERHAAATEVEPMLDIIRTPAAWIRGQFLHKNTPPLGISNKRLSEVNSKMEEHLLKLFKNTYVHDNSNFGKFASTLSYVTDRVSKHLHQVIIDKVETVNLFDRAVDLNAFGVKTYGGTWWPTGDALGAWIDFDGRLILDGAGFMEENDALRKKMGFSEADFENMRRRTYAHELGHIIDWHPKNSEGERLKTSMQLPWLVAFENELKGKDHGFHPKAMEKPNEAFAEMVAFLLVPDSMNLRGFHLKPQGSPQEQARDFCQRTYPESYATLQRYGIV